METEVSCDVWLMYHADTLQHESETFASRRLFEFLESQSTKSIYVLASTEEGYLDLKLYGAAKNPETDGLLDTNFDIEIEAKDYDFDERKRIFEAVKRHWARLLPAEKRIRIQAAKALKLPSSFQR